MKNIIIFGEIGAGKDTVAEMFEKAGWQIGKLGAPIRKMVDESAQLMNISKEDVRSLYVNYGQSMRRMFGEDLWCMNLLARDQAAINEKRLCIADARQANELRFFAEDMDFVPIAVVAKDSVRINRIVERDGVSPQKNADEETEIQARYCVDIVREVNDKFLIKNDGTLEELQAKVDAIVAEIKA